MTTTSPAPTTAAGARALATVLAEQETALEQARDVRVTAALEVLAAWRFGTRTPELGQTRDAAEQAWAATTADPGATLEDLFASFTALKAASAVYFHHAASNAGEADRRLGMAHRGYGGSDSPRPHPTHDYLAGTSFNEALAGVIASRAQAAIAAETLSVNTRTAAAMANAEQG